MFLKSKFGVPMLRWLILSLVTFCGFPVFAEELKITTYYPSPYGVYNELRAKRMAVGTTYFDSTQLDLTGREGQLFVEGGIAIGTTMPVDMAVFTVSAKGSLARAGSTVPSTPDAGVLNFAADSDATAEYATIVGGNGHTASGLASFVGGGEDNVASGNYSFVGGGTQNEASGDYSVVVGGGPILGKTGAKDAYGADIIGYFGNANRAQGGWSFVGGGRDVSANGDFSLVGGGLDNDAYSEGTVIVGGGNNKIGWDAAAGRVATYSFIGGGRFNEINESESSIVGGNSNIIDFDDALSPYAGMSGRAFIGGGGNNRIEAPFAVVFGGNANRVLSQYGVIGGGSLNIVSTSSEYSSIAGGNANLISNASNAFIGGGDLNTVVASYASIVGGQLNGVAGAHSVIIGGEANMVSGGNSAITGGKLNKVTADYSVIGGGVSGNISASHAFVGGGNANEISVNADYSAIGGGELNTIAPESGNQALSSFIGGGRNNLVTMSYSGILGGNDNIVNGVSSGIAGGYRNTIGYNTEVAFIGGGKDNQVSGNMSAIVGGNANVIDDVRSSFVGAGKQNKIHNGSVRSAIIAGTNNTLSNVSDSVIVAGGNNAITDNFTSNTSMPTNSVIIGGINNRITNAKRSIIIGGGNGGVGNTVTTNDTVLISGGNGFNATGAAYAGKVILHSPYGVRLQTNAAQYCAYVGGASMSCVSDARVKKDVKSIQDFSGIERLRPVTFLYKDSAANNVNYGFIAQEVLPIFPYAVTQGADGMYSLTDAAFTPLLVGYAQKQQKELDELRKEAAALRKEIEALEKERH
jgi:hypothetical protein